MSIASPSIRSLGLTLIVSAAVATTGCGNSPDKPAAIAGVLKPLEQKYRYPFEIGEVTVDLSDEKSADLREIQFRMNGKCTRTIYVELDRKKVFGEGAGNAFYQNAERGLAFLPADKAAELAKLKPTPKTGRIFRLVCKQGDACHFRGTCTAKRVDGAWTYEKLAVHQTAPLGATGQSAFLVNGQWQNEPTTNLVETLQGERRQVEVRKSEWPTNQFDLNNVVLDQVPTGGQLLDIHAPDFDQTRSQDAAAKNNFRTAVESALQEIWKIDFAERQKILGLIKVGKKWTFKAPSPNAGAWTLEIRTLGGPESMAAITSEDGKKSSDYKLAFHHVSATEAAANPLATPTPLHYELTTIPNSPTSSPLYQASKNPDEVEQLSIAFAKGSDHLQIKIGTQFVDLTPAN